MSSQPNLSTTTYQSISSPPPTLVSQSAQLMALGHNVFTSKFIPGTPPEAHRYTPDAYRLTVEPIDPNRYTIDSQRMSVDPYRQTSTESQRISNELPRMREEHLIESYQRISTTDPYRSNPIDLQRIPDPGISQLSTSQRMTPELQRIQTSDPQRIIIEDPRSPVSEVLSRITEPTLSVSTTSISNAYRTMGDSLRPTSESPQRVILHDTMRTHPDSQRLVQEASLRAHTEAMRLTPESSLRTHQEVPRMTEEAALRSHAQDATLRTHLEIQRMLQDSSLRNHTEQRIIEDATLRTHPDTSRLIQDTGVRTHVDASMVGQRTNADAQRMVQESLGLRDYFPPQRDIAETIRSPEQRGIPENLSYTSAESIRGDTVRYINDINTQRSLVPENLRVGAETPHPMMPENLRVVSEASNMVPENLCISEPQHQLMPENLRIGSDLNGSTNGITNGTAHLVEAPPESPMPSSIRHYTQAPHRMMPESPHPMRDSLRVESPGYSDAIYRNDIHNHIVPPAPPTPAPSVPPVPDPCSTPASQYYSGPFTPHTPHTPQFNPYINDTLDDRNPHDTGLTLDDRMDSCYQDIKPFDQEYPLPLHISQDSALPPPPPLPKPPKPKKPKEPKPPRVPVVHKCGECDRVFKNSTQLKNHMWRHTGEKPFACDECGSRFTQQGNLRAHRRIHTGERPYQCSECQSCFTQLSTLKTHQKIHSDERPYQCDQCDAAFRQIANLKTHQVTHTGERPHKCDECDKAFTQKSNLKAHKNRVHTGEPGAAPSRRGRKRNPMAIKPFTCLECGAKFTMISNLKIHSKLHSGDRPFECDFCGAGFAQNSNLKTHVQRMHGRGPGAGRRRIRCDECPAMFRLKRCLKTHKKKRHPIKSLKIKILRQSRYLMHPEEADQEELMDEEEDDDLGDEEEEDEDEEDEEEEDEEEEEEDEIVPSGGGESTSFINEPIVQISEPKEEPADPPLSPIEAAERFESENSSAPGGTGRIREESPVASDDIKVENRDQVIPGTSTVRSDAGLLVNDQIVETVNSVSGSRASPVSDITANGQVFNADKSIVKMEMDEHEIYNSQSQDKEWKCRQPENSTHRPSDFGAQNDETDRPGTVDSRDLPTVSSSYPS